MSFEKLMAELAQAGTDQETLTKAIAAGNANPDDEKIEMAAEAGETDGGDGSVGNPDDESESKEKTAKPKLGGEDGAEAKFAKSFTVTLEDGTQVEAQDGAEMIKALTGRLDAAETGFAKAITSAVVLIKGQGEMLKSLHAKLGEQAALIKSFGAQGAGRKATLVVTPKGDDGGTGGTGDAGGITGQEFMVKAMAAQASGHLMARDISAIENYVNRGAKVPQTYVDRVAAASAK